MHRQGVLLFGLLGAALAAGCGGNVILDSGGSGAASTGEGGAGAGGAGVGGAGPTSTGTLGGSGFTCEVTTPQYQYCAEYDNLPAADTQAVQAECTAAGGTPGTSCPSAGRLGTCSETAGGINYLESFYAGSNLTAMQAQQACTASGGIWTAG